MPAGNTCNACHGVDMFLLWPPSVLSRPHLRLIGDMEKAGVGGIGLVVLSKQASSKLPLDDGNTII
jgi:hypothetical protein